MQFCGIVPPIATPINEQEMVDEKALRALTRYLLNSKVHGIFVLGSTGEFAHLTDRERLRAIKTVISEVKGKVPVLVGVTESGTKRAIFWAKEAKRLGASGIVAAPPFYYPLSEKEIELHYIALASETDLPILLYHIPSTTKIRFSLELVERLSGIENIVGIKDSTGDLNFFFSLVDRMRGRNFVVFQGHDALLASSLLYGAHGGINSLANLVPNWFVSLYDATQKNDATTAYAWQQRINELARKLEEISFLPALKLALHYKGLAQPFVTSPFKPLTGVQKRKVVLSLKDAEAL
ncbi:MAG: dihydrodipicolinate synthase family protein [Armatimonadetes bacterium]|nr:dihydrodipicolinate synthase family protein [Armatimonadota bacterium]MDW8028371.1 dihydrodipicolinate synthase family protein [Armatimonadota bacterium]